MSNSKMELIKSLDNVNANNRNKNSAFSLPPINTDNKNINLIEPHSILTKFIRERKNNFIRYVEEELKRPIKININNIRNKKENKLISKNDKAGNVFITENNMSRITSSNKDKETDSQNNDFNSRVNTIPNEPKKFNKFLNSYSRLRSYQPIISENWKYKSGLRLSVGSDKINSSPMQNDIDYQFKIINDEYRLLEDNYTFYIKKVIPKPNYYQSFSSNSLILQINYNKALEETIGILYILPQLLLGEFYKLIKNYSGVKIPKKRLLKETIIKDEDKCLSYNNVLLVSIYDFFKSCYEVYTTLLNEVNDMYLKRTAFVNVINCFQKARFNLSYCSSASENALKNYDNDLKSIKKIKKEKFKTISVDLTVKMRNQFDFKKNAEKQRIMRIENALENKYGDEEGNKSKKRNKSHKKQFISFVDSKYINGLMKHFTGKVRNEIDTQRINKEIDGNYGDDDEFIRTKRRVVKIDI